MKDRMKNHRASWASVAALAVAAMLGGPAAARTAREILDQVKTLDDTTRKWTDRTQTMTLHIHSKGGGERQRSLKIYDKRYPDDENKTISFFLAPPEVEGTSFLQWAHKQRADDQWLYLPEFKRTRKITAQIRDQSFMGTDFSYRDLEILGEIQDWTEDDAPSALLGTESVDGHECHMIELRPAGKDAGYERIVLWMDAKGLVLRKMNFHEKGDALVKTLTLSDIRDVGPIPTAHRMEMQNVKKGTRTVVDLTDVRFDAGLADDLFTQRQLERGLP
jgi:outer membrane lipoprotein-sorting protein